MIVCASTNPAKLEPVKHVFATLEPELPVIGLSLPSGVPDQPIGWAQTVLGARNRAAAALAHPGALYGVGLEGGFVDNDDGAWLVSIAAVEHASGRTGLACGGWLQLPPKVAARVRAGEELSRVMDDVAAQRVTQTTGGAIGVLTAGRYTRSQMWTGALELALAPITAKTLYMDG